MKTIEAMLNLVQDVELKNKLQKIYNDTKETMLLIPASTKYHHAYKGGYHDHIQQIMYFGIRIFKFMDKSANLTCTQDDVILATFVHDFDKLNKYVEVGEVKSGENKGKVKFGKTRDWEIDPYAKATVMLAEKGIFLNDELLHALTYSAGGWSEFAKHGSDMSNLATILHCADMLSAKCTPEVERLKIEKDNDKD